jgi:hypothetical protein
MSIHPAAGLFVMENTVRDKVQGQQKMDSTTQREITSETGTTH